jgi:acyl-CoA thioester hydrolase
MVANSQKIQVRWSDLDPNFHLRHSVYYDWGALNRIEIFNEFNLTLELMQKMKIGPILFREECIFRKEIVLNDPVSINFNILKSKKDYSRWTIQHTILKNEKTVSAILTVDGAWLDTEKRKLVKALPQEFIAAFASMPLHENFLWID